jgi:hypothetical protein
MSSSIDIPTRPAYSDGGKAAAASASASSSSSSTYSVSPRTPQNQTATAPITRNTKYGHDRRPSLLSKSYLVPRSPRAMARGGGEPRRHPQLSTKRKEQPQFFNLLCGICKPVANCSLGSSLSKQEHTVINIGDPDGAPRLVSLPPMTRLPGGGCLLTFCLQITCVRSSQGFDWNPGMLHCRLCDTDSSPLTTIQRSFYPPTWSATSSPLSGSESLSTRSD